MNRTLEECLIIAFTALVAVGVFAFTITFCASAGVECWHRCSKAWDRWLKQRADQKQAKRVVVEAEQYVRTAQQPREGEQ